MRHRNRRVARPSRSGSAGRQGHLDRGPGAKPAAELVSSPMRERGMPRGAGGGSAVKIKRPVAAPGAAVPPVWLLAVTMLAVVATWLPSSQNLRYRANPARLRLARPREKPITPATRAA